MVTRVSNVMGDLFKIASGPTQKGREFRNRRSPHKPTMILSSEEYEDYCARPGRKRNISNVFDSDGMISFTINKPKWQRFEDKVWNMFYHLESDILPIGDTVLFYDDSNSRQIDGVYADEKYLYIVECKYRSKKSGRNQPPGGILDDVRKWHGQWKRVCRSLSEIPEIGRERTPIFVLATYGVEWTKQLKDEVGEIGVLIDNSQIDGVIDLKKNIGLSAKAVFTGVV